jgi:hypothetical protein
MRASPATCQHRDIRTNAGRFTSPLHCHSERLVEALKIPTEALPFVRATGESALGDAKLSLVLQLMQTALMLLAAGGVSVVAVLLGGTWGPCGPSSEVGLLGVLGVLVCFPLAGILFLGCALRTLVRSLRRGTQNPA